MQLVPEVTFACDGFTVRLSAGVVDFLTRQRQGLWFQNERAGQLFGTFLGGTVTITEATGPRRGDRANHISYDIDPKAAQIEIDDRFARGLHFVGDWHTHPEREPTPSKRDLKSMRALFRTSKHDLNETIMLIVGFDEAEHWWCSLHGSKTIRELDFLPPEGAARSISFDTYQ